MTCKEFRENIADLFDSITDKNDILLLEEHLSNCSDCRKFYEEYENTIRIITPKKTLETVNNLKISAKKEVSFHQKKRNHFWKQSAAAVAIFVVGTIFGLSNFFTSSAVASSASNLIEQSTINMRNVGDFSMTIQVRTIPNENFAYISPDAPFVTHYLSVAHVGKSVKWRLEKENGRILVCDGEKQYLWTKEKDKIHRYNASNNINEFFGALIHPDILFEYEKNLVENSSSDKYSVTTTDSTVTLTIYGVLKEKALPFLSSNTSIYNSDNRREYIFDKETNLLKELRFWMKVDGTEILVLESKQIKYNVHLDLAELTSLPVDNTKSIDIDNAIKDISSERLAFLQKETATEASERILNAIFMKDLVSAKEALLSYDLNKLFKSCEGYKIKSIDTSFESRDYGGTYVVVKVITPNSETKEIILAVSKDNSQKIWMLDGGL